ncbi:beta-hexosaminidase beta chain [Sodiomyces alkalinus F11]|uniref:Beta-hexosaminidase n=1 Tax=Sodiomyces alkalinus (strain CBS 110278 / VKM F-3762 / F11) TaxID=1314773 RepID=A0A3N2PSK9_SODAK|nr:beta-hexosaminidase beta chain [Sodiomyces alkalinus F11]ROT37470.1 beta-hexosaminidase beta chain [Sodiomyces alkalinus F11]
MLLKRLTIHLSLAVGLGQVEGSIWPAPAKLQTGDKVLFIDQTLSITYNGEFVRWCSFVNPSTSHRHKDQHDLGQIAKDTLNIQLPYTYGYTPAPGADYNSKEIVQAGVSRTLSAIFHKNLVPWMLHDKHADFEPDLYASNGRVTALHITQTDTDDEESPYTALAGEIDESYSLVLAENGMTRIEAETSVGVLRALESFNQLFYQHSSGNAWYTPLAPVSVEDAPQYPYRGLMMDTSRHFFPVKDILRTIDAMSWSKLNKLHIHATDSQSWPLEIPSLPELSAKGSYARGLVYTPQDLQHIHEYAIHRGVQVILEIDMPGHSGAIALSYPELVVAYNKLPYHWWCVQPPCGGLKLNDSRVDDFLDTLFDDLLPRVGPYTAYFHTGGDELNKNSSRLEENVGTNDTAVLQPLLQKWMDKNLARVRSHGLVPMVWQEMPLEWNITLGDDVVVQAWLGGSTIKDLVSMGHKVIDSDSNFWYLDCGRGAWLNFDNGAAYETFYPFNDWCSPTKSWQLIYSHDPRQGLTEDEAKLVLGGEVPAWSETIDSANLDMVLWPRASALGEVLWSGRIDPATGENRSQFDAAPRLSELRERMVARGVGAAPISQLFCSQSSPEECAFLM